VNDYVHLDRDPVVRPYPFANELGGQLSSKKANVKYGLSIVVVVGCEMEIFQEIV
jgi:hypothetical protein